jgi:hypothetical protein
VELPSKVLSKGRINSKHFIQMTLNIGLIISSFTLKVYVRVKNIPIIGHGGLRAVYQSYAPAAPYPQEDSWYSFLLEVELIPGP